jgi:hypothetical protein
MNKGDEITLWLGATRYYLGRRTYAVGNFCDMLIVNWSSFDEATKNLLIENIETEFDNDDLARLEGRDYKPLGDNCDRQSWERARNLWKKR